MSSSIQFEISDHVATITLDRPDSANAIDVELARALMNISIRCSEDASVRALVITGAGRFFSAGGDLKAFAASSDGLAPHIKEVTTYLHAAISRFTRMDSPVIAAVNGMAAGAGMSLVCACDFVIAAESARFTMAYTKAGLTPDGSSTYFLPRIVGLKRALDLALTNRMLSAAEAADWGIVTRVVPDDSLLDETAAFAAQLAAGATGVLGRTKKLMHDGFAASLESQMEDETQSIAASARTAEGVEGVNAFLEKRAPDFLGL